MRELQKTQCNKVEISPNIITIQKENRVSRDRVHRVKICFFGKPNIISKFLDDGAREKREKARINY